MKETGLIIKKWCRRLHCKWLHRLIKWACGKITGHSPSHNEWGYGGGRFVDSWCKHCDQILSVPLDEFPAPNAELEEAVKQMRK